MAADNVIQLPIEVTGDAEARIKRVTEAVQKLETKGTQSLNAFGEASAKAFDLFAKGAVVVGSIEAIKKAMDLTFEAETVRAINGQFELLAKNVGISGDALKEGLVGAADGLIDDTDLIKLANQAIVEMGASAAKLPPVMDLARKATAVFGGELAHNFEALEHAIATGQTRALKQFGIVVDSEKAYKAFAVSVGATADTLSEAGKQQAILNAVLSQGQKQFEGVDVNMKEATDTFQRLKVTLSQIGEVATLAFEKLAGPTVRNLLKGLSDIAAASKQAITASFGDGVEKAQASVEVLTAKVTELKGRLVDLEQKKLGHVFDFSPGDTASQLQALPKLVAEYEAKLAAANTELAKFNAKHEETASKAKGAAQSYVDLAAAQAKLAEEGKKVAEHLVGEDPAAKYEKDLNALSAYLVSKQQITDDDAALFDKLEEDRDAKAQEKTLKQISDLQAKNDALKALNTNLYADQIAANQDAIDQIALAQGRGSVAYLQNEQKKAKAEVEIRQATANTVSGILGGAAAAAKAFGKDGFEVFQALAKAQALVNTYAAAQAAYASAAAIPIAGPVLAPIAAAAAIAAGFANVAAINAQHLAGGIDSVPAGFERDNFPAYLQSGERVVPRESNRKLTAMLDGEGPMIAVLEDIRNLIGRQPGAQVYLDGRMIFDSMRSQLQAGRAFA